MENKDNYKYIAFIDILGFKELIEKKTHEELIKIYENGFTISNQISSSKNNYIEFEKEGKTICTPDISKSEVNSFLFSDSIVYWTNDNSENSFKELLVVVKNTFRISFLFGLPLRGAISVGELTFRNYAPQNQNNVFIQNCIVGKGLSETYVLESKQIWSGCIISEKCIEFIEKDKQLNIIESLLNTNDLIKYDVPMKNNKQGILSKISDSIKKLFNKKSSMTIKNSLVLNWMENLSNMSEDKINELFAKYGKDISNPDVQIKIKNTIKFYQYLKNL